MRWSLRQCQLPHKFADMIHTDTFYICTGDFHWHLTQMCSSVEAKKACVWRIAKSRLFFKYWVISLNYLFYCKGFGIIKLYVINLSPRQNPSWGQIPLYFEHIVLFMTIIWSMIWIGGFILLLCQKIEHDFQCDACEELTSNSVIYYTNTTLLTEMDKCKFSVQLVSFYIWCAAAKRGCSTLC